MYPNSWLLAQGLEGDRFFEYLKDAFDVLWEEGATKPKMMSIGLHCRCSKPERQNPKPNP